jgi:hypothetical protein
MALKPGAVSKTTALEALEKRRLQVSDFAKALSARGCRCPGPRKAWNVLVRLLKQGLVCRIEDEAEISYAMGRRDGRAADQAPPVVRRQHRILWALTKRGRDRLTWLRGRLKSSPARG